jgi:hypothetical protein
MPSRPTSATVASQVPSAVFAHRGMNIFAPGTRSALSPGIKFTTVASAGTTIVFSPSLYYLDLGDSLEDASVHCDGHVNFSAELAA